MNIEIVCPERWNTEWKISREAVRDGVIKHSESLYNVAERCFNWLSLDDIDRVVIGTDFCKHCFSFAIYRIDGSLYMNGGIIFHGLPATGYQENGSVSANPSYGWQIHT